jgi:DNA-binding GntR family transcriptional regulator
LWILCKHGFYDVDVPSAQTATPPTRAAWVDGLLRRAILSGELAPGERLHAEKLAAKWGVSATPLRETFQRLAGDGLVVVEPQRGARVAPLDADEAVEIYEMRLLLDPAALRASMEVGANDGGYQDDVDLALRKLSVRHRSLVAFHEAHRAFHLACVSRCPNSRLLRQVEQLLEHSQRFQVVSRAAGAQRDAGAEHQALRDAIAAGRTASAADLLERHLRGTLDAVRTHDRP